MIWHGLNNIYTHVDGGQKIYHFNVKIRSFLEKIESNNIK